MVHVIRLALPILKRLYRYADEVVLFPGSLAMEGGPTQNPPALSLLLELLIALQRAVCFVPSQSGLLLARAKTVRRIMPVPRNSCLVSSFYDVREPPNASVLCTATRRRRIQRSTGEKFIARSGSSPPPRGYRPGVAAYFTFSMLMVQGIEPEKVERWSADRTVRHPFRKKKFSKASSLAPRVRNCVIDRTCRKAIG